MAITYGGVPLLSTRDRETPEFGAAARRLARRVGLDVGGANELVWPSGADRVGGMIGMIEQARLEALLEPWNDWRGEGAHLLADLPRIDFHDAPRMNAAVAEVEPLTDAADGLHLIAFVDPRHALRELPFAAATSPDLVDWPTALEAVIEAAGIDALLSYTVEDRLAPEVDDPRVLAMTAAEWLEAAAWSVGGAWRLLSNGSLELQSVAQADDAEEDNRELPTALARGSFDVAPSRPLSAIRMGAGNAVGAVPFPRGSSILSAENLPAGGVGKTWRPTSTALWEQAPVDGSQFNGPELQTLAEALLADAQGWTNRPYRVELAGFVPWVPSARDRTVRWIDRGRDKCRTIVETLSPADLPSLLVHRSSVAPREGSLTEARAEGSATNGSFVTVTLAASMTRPEREAIAWFPTHPPGWTVVAGQSVWVDYDRTTPRWILVPWTTSP